jgi:hypothetical protein
VSGGRVTDEALWQSVVETVRDVLLPALEGDEWARLAALQVVGLAHYARDRGEDPRAARREEVAAVLGRLGLDPGEDPLVTAGATLAVAVGHDDADAALVRSELRPVLVRHLDEDLAETMVMMAGFRGRLPDA